MTSLNNKRNEPKMYSLSGSSKITNESDNKIKLDVTKLGNTSLLCHSIKI